MDVRGVRAAKPLHGQVGETLIETLASIVLLAIVAVGVIGSLGTDVIASARDRETATTESVVRSFAAWVDANVGPTNATYQACTSGSSVNPYYGAGPGQWTSASLGYTAPSGFIASAVGWGPNLSWGANPTGGVGYWSAGTTSLSGNPQTTCPGPDALLQLTLRITTDTGTGAQSVDVMVRKP